MLNVSDGFLSLLDGGGEVREDVRLPQGELGDAIKNQFDRGGDLLVVILQAAHRQAIVAMKNIHK